MDSEFFDIIKSISLEAFCISVCVFVFTMLIKLPIKKYTSKLSEDKRKAINTVILFIPIVLSLLFSVFYYGLFKHTWLSITMFETATSAWIISLSIYAIYERIIILIRGIMSGKLKADSDITKETLSFLKSNIKALTSKMKVDEKQIKNIQKRLTSLLEFKNSIETCTTGMNIAKLSETNIQIQQLKNEEQSLQKLTKVNNK